MRDQVSAQEGLVAPDERTSSPSYLYLLVMDPDRATRHLCREVATAAGFSVHCAGDLKEALGLLRTRSIGVVIVGLPERSCITLLREACQQEPNAEVIVLAATASLRSVVRAMKAGAYEYLEKPVEQRILLSVLKEVREYLEVKADKRRIWSNDDHEPGLGGLIGRAPEMERLYRIIAKAAHSRHPVLILGESGTGKELVARSIHFSGPQRDKPFIPVDCGSLVPTLIESELFGYVRGAFTGAARSKEGLLAIAEGGTVFLDEVGELPVDLQAKLLRAVQEKEIRPVGSTRRVPINVRILAATHRDLEVGVAQGTFRRDLYFRLNVLSLRIPPLRERRQDIPLLVGYFLERLSEATGIRREISDEALKMMLAYDWPGNVRELENSLERACALSSGRLLHASDFGLMPDESTHNVTPDPGGSIRPLAEVEKQAILEAIQRVDGDKVMAARLLGIGKTTMYRKLSQYVSAARD